MNLKMLMALTASMSLLLTACKKGHTPAPNPETSVRITVLASDGQPVSGAEVRIYDETGREALENNPFTSPLESVRTGTDGVAQYTLRGDKWFSDKRQRYVTFAVLQGNAANHQLWAVSRTIQVGQSQQIEIRLTGSDKNPENPSESILESLRVSHMPDKRIYTLGETLDLSGLEVTGHYKDGKEQTIRIAPDQVQGFSSEQPVRELTLTVEAEGKQTSFTVQVLPLLVKEGMLTRVMEGYDEITLPEGIRGIAEKAFAASKITKLTLNEGLQSIGEMAFCGSSIRELVLPESLETLGEYAFYHCEALTRVDMSRTKVTMLPRNLFAYAGIEKLAWPSATVEIGTQCFLATTRLKRAEIPETVRQIGFEAFRESGVETVVLPEGVKELAGRAFYLCKALTEISVHGTTGDTADGVIRGSCFVECPALKQLAIPRNIRSLEQSLLTRNTLVTSITLPAGVREIAFGAFDNTGIREVRMEAATPPTAGLIRDQWYGFPKGVEKIHVPAGTADAYKKAAGWSRFADRIE